MFLIKTAEVQCSVMVSMKPVGTSLKNAVLFLEVNRLPHLIPLIIYRSYMKINDPDGFTFSFINKKPTKETI